MKIRPYALIRFSVPDINLICLSSQMLFLNKKKLFMINSLHMNEFV